MSYNEWLDIDVLEDYLDGKLDAKTMYRVEKLSLEDPFVADALAGLSQSPKRTQSLSLLQKQLQQRIAQKPVVQKRWRITSQRLSIAAAAAVLFVTVSVLFWMKENNRQQQLIANQSKKVEVNLAPQVAKVQPLKQPEELAMDKAVIDSKSQNQALNKPKRNKIIIDRPIKVATEQSAPTLAAATIPMAVSRSETSTNVNKKESAIATELINQALMGKVAGITINSKAKSEIKPNVLKGTVYAKEDGSPLPGAAVKVAGSNIGTVTNAKGEFNLLVDSNDHQQLSIAYLGYATKEIKAKANQAIDVELEADHNSLNEIIVTSAGGRNKKAVNIVKITPMPTEGWENLSKYFNANNKLLTNGIETGKLVKLSFRVQKNGRPTNIKIIKGLSKAENVEALRLINDGPNWTLPPNSSTKVELNINF